MSMHNMYIHCMYLFIYLSVCLSVYFYYWSVPLLTQCITFSTQKHHPFLALYNLSLTQISSGQCYLPTPLTLGQILCPLDVQQSVRMLERETGLVRVEGV